MKLRLPVLLIVSVLTIPCLFAQNLEHTVGTSTTTRPSSTMITTTVGTQLVQWYVFTNTLPVTATVRVERLNAAYYPGVGVYTDTTVITDTSNLSPGEQLAPGGQDVMTSTLLVDRASVITSTALLTLMGGAQILTATAPVVIYGVLDEMQVTEVPTLSGVGMVLFATLLAVVGYGLIRRGSLI